MNENIYLTVEKVIQIKSGIMINVYMSAKIKNKIICAKNIIFGTWYPVVAKIVNM